MTATGPKPSKPSNKHNNRPDSLDRPVKIDLHTHSIASPDGALTTADYRRMLESGRLDYIAVTDHNTIDFAVALRKELGREPGATGVPGTAMGDRIIIGEEIRTTKGEIIGLYLQRAVPKLLSPVETIAAIRAQGGLVCIPHPFENVRRGISPKDLEAIVTDIDMIEVHNGRAVFQNKSKQAYAWAALHGCAGVASSDSHGVPGWGRTYTVLQAAPNRATLVALLQNAVYQTSFPGTRAVLYPKFNKMKTRFRRLRQEYGSGYGGGV